MEVKIKGVYKHFKGDYYIVEDVAIHSETKEKYVVYRGLYEDGKDHMICLCQKWIEKNIQMWSKNIDLNYKISNQKMCKNILINLDVGAILIARSSNIEKIKEKY